MTLDSCLKSGINKLQESNITDSEYDAFVLMEEVTGISRNDYFLRKSEEISVSDYDTYMKLIERRLSHIPLQHITGRANFYGYEFLVDENVLIPRLDTEVLVEKVLELKPCESILDMCCGSGCIGISLYLENVKRGLRCSVTATDISPKAIDITRENVNRLIGADGTFHIRKSDLFTNIDKNAIYDIIVCNPPYIPTKDIESLDEEVRLHDPIIALDGNEDGMSFYKRIIPGAKEYIASGGHLCFEIGYNQGSAVRDIMVTNGYTGVEVYKDLAGFDRVVIGRLP